MPRIEAASSPFLRRLAAIVPRPYANGVRYHGVFANRSKDRPLLPPPPASRPSMDPPSSTPIETPPSTPAPPPIRSRRLAWAQLLVLSRHTPKIFFTDIGLAAFLLGIHTQEQASHDPLRGNLYENLIVADIVKGALNKGIRPEIYFFRDSHGNEVDLLIREKGALIPVEIKSAGTFSVDFIKGLERFKALKIKRFTAGAVLYNGEQQFDVRGVRVFNPLLVDNIWETLTGLG